MKSMECRIKKSVITCVMASSALLSVGGTDLSTAADFVAQLTADPAGSYTLTADIDLTGSDYTTLSEFSGTLDGAGHTLTGIGAKTLFTSLSGTVKNVTVDGGGATLWGTQIGVVCKEARGATFEDVAVGNATVLVSGANAGTGIGLFAGMAYEGTTFTRCQTLANATVSGNNIANDNVGGFVGKALNGAASTGLVVSFTDCTNNAPTTAYSPNNNGGQGHGGFVGSAALTAAAGYAPEISFTRCVNMGDITVKTKAPAGGFVGRYASSTAGTPTLRFTGCANFGTITRTDAGAATDFGGFIGFVATNSRYVYFTDCINVGDVNVGSLSNAGGFIGFANVNQAYVLGTFLNSANYGAMTGKTSGGFIGSFTCNQWQVCGVEVKNCANYGTAAGELIGLCTGMKKPRTMDNIFTKTSTLCATLSSSVAPTPTNAKTAEDATACADLNAVAEATDGYDAWVVGGDGYPHLMPFVRKVTFADYDGSTLAEQYVGIGASAVAPADPVRAGYSFEGWDKDLGPILAETTITATYKQGAAVFYTVSFRDWDGTVLKEETVQAGRSAEAPSDPVREGYIFLGWDASFDEINAETVVTAMYELQDKDIGSMEEFAASIVEGANPKYVFHLTEDITLESWTSIDFAATLDGHGHTIYGLNTCLFKELKGSVRNVVIDGGEGGTVVTQGVSVDFGFVARTLVAGHIENVVIRNMTFKRTYGGGGAACFGIVVGVVSTVEGTTAVVSNCTTEASCKIVNTSANNCVGGVVGKVSASGTGANDLAVVVVACTNAAPVVANNATMNGTHGGVVAQVEGFSRDFPGRRILVRECVNRGALQGADTLCVTNSDLRVGGIVGRISGDTNGGGKGRVMIENCVNEADVGAHVALGTCGGILGTGAVHPAIVVTNCVTRGDVGNVDAGVSGGMIGGLNAVAGNSTYIYDSAEYGAVRGAYVSPYVGRYEQNTGASGLQLTVVNCGAYGDLGESGTAGRFIGRFATELGSGAKVFEILATNDVFVAVVADPIGANATPAESEKIAVSEGRVFTVADTAGVSAKDLRRWARENGFGEWCLGKLSAGVVVPELTAFCAEVYVPGFRILIR